MKTIQAIAFINEISLSNDGWGMLAPFGDYPGKALIKQQDGTFKKVNAIQRIDKLAADGMVAQFKSLYQSVKRYLTGCPIFAGHGDVPTMANEYPDKNPKGTIVDLEVRADGLYCKPVFTNEGSEIIESKKLRAFSGYWDAEEIGEYQGSKVYRPSKLISAALTNRPNLPVQLLNEKETPTPKKKNTMLKIIEALTGYGITIANEATEEQVSEALKSLGEKAKSADTLAAEKATLANEKAKADGELSTAKNSITSLTQQVESGKTAFANERKLHIANLIGIALVTGKITAAEKPLFESRLAVETNFANEAQAIIALQPQLKTESATLNINGNSVSIANAQERREVVEKLVKAEMASNGGDYGKAWSTVQRTHPALFEAMKKPAKA